MTHALLHVVLGLSCITTAQVPPPPAGGGPLDAAIVRVTPRVVKIFGARIGRDHGYGSGVIISADGRIVTTLSLLLEGQTLKVVTADGVEHAASIVARDEVRQLALLKIAANGLAAFELSSPPALKPGDWVLSAGNPFQVAQGDEPVSIGLGVVSAETNLSGRRRAADYPYTGPVVLVDVLVATPGYAGGALVDLEGRLVGVIGNAVINDLTNTWINYALPVAEVAAFVEAADRGETQRVATPAPAETPAEAVAAARVDLGIRLFEIGGRNKPAFVERVRMGSAAREAGLQRDDLIISVNGRTVGDCEAFHAAVAGLKPGDAVELVVKRKNELKTIRLTAGAE
ncbi:MAG: Periplasmic serine endoprotease DegP [Phycisphaerae bacterium]|nr:Periplasmic serine endoprotease DegP [Phycisphaerae bacterium]